MTFPLVSVVIPAYNSEEWIPGCIMSVLMQDYPNIEIILVDDASMDNTKSFATEVLSAQSRYPFKVISHTKNLGECVSSYDGFEAAKGKYICRLSSDDMYFRQDHISGQVATMEKSGSDWCYNSNNLSGPDLKNTQMAQSFWLPVPTKFFRAFFQRFDNWILRHPHLVLFICLKRNAVNSSSLMVRGSCYNEVKWCRKYRTDCDGMLLMRMLLHKKIGIAIQPIGVFYRIHPNQGSYKKEYINDMKEVRDYVRNEIRTKTPLWLRLLTRYA